jgi:plastocyanin
MVIALLSLASVCQTASAYNNSPLGKAATQSSSLGNAPSSAFKNCAKLLAKYPRGIARNKKAAGVSGAFVNAKLYTENRRLDTNYSGVACRAYWTNNSPTTTIASPDWSSYIPTSYTFTDFGSSDYSTSSYQIHVGDTVNWPGSYPASFDNQAGVTSFTFTTPGTFSFVCVIHGPQMNGSVIVTK